jgi:prefoldin subunit 5
MWNEHSVCEREIEDLKEENKRLQQEIEMLYGKLNQIEQILQEIRFEKHPFVIIEQSREEIK